MSRWKHACNKRLWTVLDENIQHGLGIAHAATTTPGPGWAVSVYLPSRPSIAFNSA